jgi:translocation and assembly module TamA
MILGCMLMMAPSPSFSEEFSYKVDVRGVENDELVKSIKASSNLIQNAKAPLSSPSVLIHRGRSDEKRVLNVLKSFGYFSGKVRIEIEGLSIQNILPSQIPAGESSKVVISISTGPVFLFDKIEIKGSDQPGLEDLSPSLQSGDAAKGRAVLDAEGKLIARTKRAGFPYARMGKRVLRIDRKKNTMDVVLTVIPGQRVLLGDITIQGLEQVKKDFIFNRIPWKLGDMYDPGILEGFRSNLSGLDLFSSIKVAVPDPPESTDTKEPLLAPVNLFVKEKEFRFFGFGGDFSTTEGIGLNAFWGHRNFFGRGEKLKVTGRLARIGENDFSNIDQKLVLDFQKPDFLSRKQNLLFNLELVDENPDAFERQAISGSLGISRPLGKTFSFTVGVTGEYSSIEDEDGTDNFALFGIPISLKQDTTRDLLDPKSGFRNEIRVTPYTTASGPGGDFTKFKLGSRGYYKVTGDGSVVLAGRVLLGSIVGASTDDIPADKRYFSGGGGSVRGYAFQNVGPLDSDNDPVGGRSVLEVGAEVRFRYKDYGLVPFIDGGQVFDNEIPKFDEELQWGVGLGVRYYSKLGPLRLDFAVPINRRDNDDPLAFYISIGQAF